MPGIDETDTSFRCRVRDPNDFDKDSFRTVPIKKTKPRVNAVMGKLKGESSMTIQSYIFPKEDGWTRKKVQRWIDDHEKSSDMNEKIERRNIVTDVETRDEDGGKTIQGYAAVFWDGTEKTEFQLWKGAKERILPGAFDRALKSRDEIVALFNHDPNQLLGRRSAGTLTLETDDKGLRYKINPADTTIGHDVTQHVSRGDLKGSSFAFLVDKQTWKKENDIDIREIQSVQLYDVGPVTYPAYKGTAVKYRDQAKRDFDKFHEAEKREMAEAERIKRNRRIRARLIEIGA